MSITIIRETSGKARVKWIGDIYCMKSSCDINQNFVTLDLKMCEVMEESHSLKNLLKCRASCSNIQYIDSYMHCANKHNGLVGLLWLRGVQPAIYG
jgi:hypothetical protein